MVYIAKELKKEKKMIQGEKKKSEKRVEIEQKEKKKKRKKRPMFKEKESLTTGLCGSFTIDSHRAYGASCVRV